MESDYISIQQATERYPIGRTTLYSLIAEGAIRSFTLGRRRILLASSIDACLARMADESDRRRITMGQGDP